MNIALAELVWERAHDCCEYCRMPQICDERPFEVDDIVAKQHVHSPERLSRYSRQAIPRHSRDSGRQRSFTGP